MHACCSARAYEPCGADSMPLALCRSQDGSFSPAIPEDAEELRAMVRSMDLPASSCPYRDKLLNMHSASSASFGLQSPRNVLPGPEDWEIPSADSSVLSKRGSLASRASMNESAPSLATAKSLVRDNA